MLNQITIMGRLTKNPELRTTKTGINTARFSIAVDRDRQDAVDFFNVIAWRKTAEFVSKYFQKGKPILIQGHIATDEYTDKEGNKRKTFEIVAENIYFCGGDKVKNETAPASLPDDDDNPFTVGEEDELPL